MSNFIRRVGLAVSGLVAEDRREFRRLDASPAKYDDGAWMARC
jgi:hypothetical protein